MLRKTVEKESKKLMYDTKETMITTSDSNHFFQQGTKNPW